MMCRMGLTLALTAVLCAATQGAANAAFDLQITEIWAGQDGPDLTPDWSEVTNYGDMPWTLADGFLFVEDDSGNSGATSPVIISGLTAIQPGESAIILHEGDALDAADFEFFWDMVKPQNGSLVGFASGGGIGLGAGGDSVNLFINAGLGFVHLDSEAYVNQPTGISWDVVLQSYSLPGNAAGAAALEVSGFGTNVASPQMVPVPEPTAVALSGLGLVLAALCSRRK
jgi:hypothetical protein